MKEEEVKGTHGKIYHRIKSIFKCDGDIIEVIFYPDWYNNIKKIRNPLASIIIKTKKSETHYELDVRDTKQLIKMFEPKPKPRCQACEERK